jgi:hypothetical protein
MVERFSPQDLGEAEDLISELFEEVASEEATLSGGTKLGIAAGALQGLRETKVTFGNPSSDLIKLDQALFQDAGIELSEIRKRQMREASDFYYMTLTVSLQPKRGAQFTLVECALDLGPKGSKEPIVQTLFPKSEWKEVVAIGRRMDLALDGNLDWGAGVDMSDFENLANLPTQIRARIVSKNQLKAFVALPEYSYKLGRTEIAATGEGNSECFWRIENPELQRAQTVKFGVVFKVPKDISSIELSGIVAAEPRMNWLVANLRHIFADLSEKLKDLFRKQDADRHGEERLPIGDHEKWSIELPN